ncbi:hypothetical protein RclHR1_00440030 [Rhizophagus clarus]|uniref:Uncharacterized protein n=1 Tax=Rhizophagus clarus TaxID=94130 RepID=A0A2Z6RIG1_9GLOM|nr:hypothetical protein RclHR1_00440030 [Rhizophagus clarus]GES93470.1 hypothetical protein GLOIN_2v1808423 [Rhizophagus clarus]
MKMQDLQDDKRSSNNSFSSKRASLRISTVTINSDTATPPPVYFTTTINDPPMPVRRNSSRSKYYQRSLKNINHPSLDLEENFSLLDNLSLYDKIFDTVSFNNSNANENNQKEKGNLLVTENIEEIKRSNPLSNPYDSSWIPEPYSSSPILSRFSLLEPNKSNSPPNLDNNNNKKKVRFITQSSNLSQIDESQTDEIDESQLQSSSGSEDNNVDTDLNATEKGEEHKSNKLKSWKDLWEMSWRDKETKKFTKKFWLTFVFIIFLILLAAIIGICLHNKSTHQIISNKTNSK